jgi:membrane-anchored glycerophosphoryl diester phosphodiesterase (GDPDase)
VSDSTNWASPGGIEPTPAGEPPRPDASPSGVGAGTGTPYGPASGAPQPSAAAPGWTPPPKPGLIPLRPLDFGTVLGACFQVLRRNPRPTFGAALLLNALVVFLSSGISTILVFTGFDRAARANAADADTILAGTVALIIVSGLLAVAVSIVAQALLQGIISIEVSRATLGEKRTLRELIALGRGRWWALIGWTALIGVAAVAAFSVLIAITVGFFIPGDPVLALVGVVVILLGGLVLVAAAIFLATKLAFVPAAIVIERLTLGDAIGRSWRLVRGAFWRVLGTLALVTVMVNIAASIVTTPFQLGATFATPVVNPAGDIETDLTLFLVLNIFVIAITAVVGAIGSVLTTAASSLLYIDRRMRTEGLDLELQRYVELQAAGTPAVDPYRRDAGTAAS